MVENLYHEFNTKCFSRSSAKFLPIFFYIRKMATPDLLQPSYDEYDDSSIFENKSGLAEDMRFLASMPELCDVTFLVGETREPVCAVKAVLCARSR